jgi:hypothetical protein
LPLLIIIPLQIAHTLTLDFLLACDIGGSTVIKRIWNGYTALDNADAYEHLLDTVVFQESKQSGYQAIVQQSCCGGT